METSLILAKLLGPYCLIVGSGLLINWMFYESMVRDVADHPLWIYLAGVLALIFGLLIVQFHNIWVVGWPVLITIVGWIGIIKGAWLIVFPMSLKPTMDFYLKNPLCLAFRPWLVIIIGVVLTYFSYFAAGR